MVLGGSNIRQRWRGSGTDRLSKKEGQGSKRSTKSEVEEEGSDRTRVRIFQPPKRRARKLIAGH